MGVLWEFQETPRRPLGDPKSPRQLPVRFRKETNQEISKEISKTKVKKYVKKYVNNNVQE